MRMSRKSKSLSTRKGNAPEGSKGQGGEGKPLFLHRFRDIEGCWPTLLAAVRRAVDVPNWERLMSLFQRGPASSLQLYDAARDTDFLPGCAKVVGARFRMRYDAAFTFTKLEGLET
jgi:hypothetical protein